MIVRLTIKQLAANKTRFFATAFAIILGVAFLAGTLILTDTIRASLNGALADADAGTDAYIRTRSATALRYGESGPGFDASVLDTVRNVEGVAAASVEVSGYAQIVDADGKAVGTVNEGVLGMNWVSVAALNPFTISAGRAPNGPDEVAIDRRSASRAHLQLGDRTTVLSSGAPFPATVVGIARFGSLDTPGALSVVLFDDETAARVLNQAGQIDAIAVTATDTVSPDVLVARLAAVVDPSQEVISGAALTAEHQAQIGEDINQFGLFLTVFALIALFVGAYIISNTFSIIVSQRTRELALLRAVGASGRQVRLAVLAEAAITALIASAIGLGAGIGVAIGLQRLLAALGIDIPLGTAVVSSTTVLVSMGVGLVLTIVSAVLPARRASQVLPIAALRDVVEDRTAVSTRRVLAAGVVGTLATVALVIGFNTENMKILGIGAVTLLLAVSAFGPMLARPLAALLGIPIARLRGTSGMIAAQNAMRNPKRTARTVASLMIGVALVSFLTIFATTLKAGGAGAFRADYRGTVVVDSGAVDAASGLSPSFAAQVRTAPGVRSVAEQRNAAVQIDGRSEILNAYDTVGIASLFDLGRVTGDLSHLGPDGIAVLRGSTDHAQLGDVRTVTFPSGTASFIVRATYEHGAAFFGDQFVDLSAFEANLPVALDARVYVDAEDIAVVEQAAAAYPTAKALSVEGFITQQNGTIDTILTLMYALLGLAVLIALLGIANTLALSIHERKRELGLLRAVGMSRSQVRSSVRWESAIIAVFGTALGVAIGAVLGWTMVRTLTGPGFGGLVIPVGSLAVVAAIAATAGVLASLFPARRAARVDLLVAVAGG